MFNGLKDQSSIKNKRLQPQKCFDWIRLAFAYPFLLAAAILYWY